MDWIYLSQGSLAGCSKRGNEPFGSMKGGKILWHLFYN